MGHGLAGRNAVHDGTVVDLLQTDYAAQLSRRRHPLLGCGTISVGAICGGSQANIVPDRCTILIDRRTLPGETEARVRREILGVLRRKHLTVTFTRYAAPCLPLQTDPRHPLVARFLKRVGQRKLVGVRYFSDASVLGHGGIPSVVFGPGDIAQAHTADEWISLAELERGKGLLLRFLQSFLEQQRPRPSPMAMIAEEVKPTPATAAGHRASFFRQSGWLMFATVAGGVFMTAVHLLSHAMPEGEYGQFVAFLSVSMFIPAMPLQMVLAQQTARALALHREHELSGLIRAAWLGTFLVWLVAVAVVLLFQSKIMAQWNISNPAAIWLTLPVLLFTAWLPMFYGVLQGQQNFLWMGWSMLVNGVGRFAIGAFAVLVLHYYAPGMVLGILGGLTVALVIAIWPTRSLWLSTPQSFEWRGSAAVIPLTLGFGAYQFLLTADTMLVRGLLQWNDSAFYGSAGTLARASMWLVGPLATVMFPKIVHARRRRRRAT